MKGKYGLFALLAALGALLSLPTWAAEDTEQTLIKLENDWCAALLKNDVAALTAILADDLTSVDPSGEAGTKSTVLTYAKTAKASVCKNEKMKVRLYGDTAVITGIVSYKDTSDGGVFQFTDTYVRRNGRWQCVADQETPVKK